MNGDVRHGAYRGWALLAGALLGTLSPVGPVAAGPDGDHTNNLEEYAAYTNPMRSDSVLRMTGHRALFYRIKVER